MAKEEKVLDLKDRKEKISSEHLEHLQKLVNRINGVHFNIGKLEGQKFMLLHDLKNAQNGIGMFQETLIKAYGSYDVNISDGVINWPSEDGEKTEDEK